MVSWSGSGKLAGYSGTEKLLVPDLYSFASPGSVDLNGITRLQWALSSTYPADQFPNRVTATATFNFVSGDFTANPGKKLSAALFVAPASAFPADYVPTPAEILAAPVVEVYRADTYVTTPQTKTFNFKGPGANSGAFQPNAKAWFLILPTALADSNSPWNVTNDKPMANIGVNTTGRAMSLWTNRTPLAPVITAPVSGTIVSPGDTINLAFSTDDPDEVAPVDVDRSNLDVAGVQIQYAAAPSPETPSPSWLDLPFSNNFDGVTSAWFIRGAADSLFGEQAILDNLGLSIDCGVREAPPLHGLLPAGNWQIRVRVFDFGHPYPLYAYPLGVPANTYGSAALSPTTYYAGNTSPWSTPIIVVIPAQVPPPTPVRPTSDLAVTIEDPVRLSWLYRNTATPPFSQRRRWIQIREIGSAIWTTVMAGLGSGSSVDLPIETIAPAPILPTDLQTDPGFESGTTGGWTPLPDPAPDPGWGPQPAPTLSNLNDAAQAHSGNRSLRLNYAGMGWPYLYKTYPVDPTRDMAHWSGWFKPAAVAEACQITYGWVDASDEYVGTPTVLNVQDLPGGGWDWFEVDAGEMTVPPTASYFLIGAVPYGPGYTGYDGTLADDVAMEAWSSTNTEDFTIEVSRNYEWRVSTEDTDLVRSDWSLPAAFWTIPGAGTGPARPVPTETVDGATLGCGKHSAFVYRRGGKTPVGQIRNFSSLDWGRVRDDISSSQIVVSDWDVDCGNLLASLQCWAYEIVIFRDNGFSVDRVWEGPITLLTYERDKVTIQAKDVMGYAYRKIIKQVMNDTGSGDTVVNRAARIIQNVFAPDDPNVLSYLTILSKEDDAREYRSTPAYSRTAFEEIDDMAANAGLDYTAVGRAIMVWGTKHRIGTLPEFEDDDLGAPPIVSEYGMSMANRYVVSDGSGVWGEATRLDVSGNDENYGVVEMLSSTWASDSTEETGTYTEAGLQTVIASFEGYAERSISDRYMPGSPVIVRVPDNTTINSKALISIQSLVPGVVIPLRSTGTLRTVVASQKLDSVKVTEQGGNEVITITLSPFSRDDVALEETA